MKLKIKTYITGLSLLLISAVAFADIAVIVNPSNSASASQKDIKKIFLGKKTSMNPVDQNEGSAIRDSFYQKVAKKDAGQMKAYWSKMIFSGKAIPPAASSNDATVKTWVVNNPKGVGYIDSSAVDDTVKVLLTIK
ncbi:hypothetical protein MNBD_GAMMA08-619 [hydrothermal vent metagenome]|uniref:ABC-type phosphate transport system, periplasmic component n=1 Tax=hydrothermal vent metagenome TaxID=652676 RepID=A0A3B0XZ19_9ZZZZ